ncbi:restriction endonuclease subunit S [Megamonas funiformis]|uniref:restriction endonuclease subunit S n=1 Tax=Megamonas funiformis TaxID=437897 RepID=UPI003520911B
MNIPKLRFKEFTDDWKTHKLKNICYINPKSSNLNDKFYYIDLECVQYGRLKYIQCINKLEAPSRAQRVLLPQDILFQSVRAYQKNSYFFKKENDIQTVASTGYAQLRTKKELSLYIYYYLYFQKFINKVNKLSTGTSYPAINSTDLGMININIPSFQEQEKIANFLSTVDKKIENLENTITSLENQKKGLLQQIFSQKLRFKDKNGNNYPNWEKKKLGDITTSYSGGTPSVNVKDYYNGTIPFIKSGEIHNSFTETFITETGLNSSSAKLVKKGDLLFALYGATSGDTSISKINGAINQAILCVRSTTLNLHYLYQLLNFYRNKLLSIYLQGGQGNFSATIFKNLIFNFPCLEEQTKIADFLSAFDRKLENQKAQLEHWQQIKKGLLQQMFV